MPTTTPRCPLRYDHYPQDHHHPYRCFRHHGFESGCCCCSSSSSVACRLVGSAVALPFVDCVSTGCATTVNDCQDPYRTGSNSNAAKDAHTEDVVVPMRSRVCRRHCIVRLDECVWMARLLLTGRQTNEADERPKSVDLAHPEP